MQIRARGEDQCPKETDLAILCNFKVLTTWIKYVSGSQMILEKSFELNNSHQPRLPTHEQLRGKGSRISKVQKSEFSCED